MSDFRTLVEDSYKQTKPITESKKESPIDENGIHRDSGLVFMNLGIAPRHYIDPKELV